MKIKYSVLLFSMFFVVLLVGGTFSSFYGQVTGNISATTDNWSFVASITNSTTVDDHFTLPLSASVLSPGSSGSFVVNVDASGTTMNIEYNVLINGSSIPTNMDFCLDSACTNIVSKENGTDVILSYNASDMTDSVTIYWKWTAGKYANDDSSFTNLQVADIYVRSRKFVEPAYMKNGKSAETEFWSDTYRPYIRTISFERGTSNVPGTCNAANLCWDISNSVSQGTHVYAYMVDSGLDNFISGYGYLAGSATLIVGNTLYDLFIACDSNIYAPSNCDELFSDMHNLININFNSMFNTGDVTNMTMMFWWNSNISYLNLSSFNTSNVINMDRMFEGCENLVELDLSHFITSKVTNMSGMFDNCQALTDLDLSNFDVENVISMSLMFDWCESLTNLDLSNFNTGNVTNMFAMFGNCSSLATLNLGGFNTSSVTNMSKMFSMCSSLTSLDLSSFNTSNVTDMSMMFQYCSGLTTLNMSNFDFSNVTADAGSLDGFYQMFINCTKLSTTINMNGINSDEYEDMFKNAATDESALIIIHYTSATNTLVSNMIATKSVTSNVVKGSLIS